MPPNITQVIKLANSEHGVKPIQLKLKVRFHSHAFSIEPLFRGQHTRRDRLRDRHRGSETDTDTHTQRDRGRESLYRSSQCTVLQVLWSTNGQSFDELITVSNLPQGL